jgi:hypothetical protein
MSNRTIDNKPFYDEPRDESPAPEIRVSSWLPIDLGPVLRGEYVAPVPTILERDDGVALFYRYCLNGLIGESESCKTWIAAVAIVQELRRGEHVILIDYESSFDFIVERLQALGASDDQITERFSYIQPEVKFGELEQVLVFEECIDKRGAPSLVIIDGITEAFSQAGLNPNEGVDVANYFAGAPRWFAKLGAAVVLVDHVTKSSDTRANYAIGSERKKSGLDGAAYMIDLLTPFGRGKTARVKLTVSKDKNGSVRQYSNTTGVIAMIELVSSLDGSITTTIEAPKDFQSGPFRPTGIMEQMSKALVAEPGMGTRSLYSVVKCKTDTKALALELLINEGFISVTKGSNNSNIHTSLKPFPPINGGNDDDLF